MTGATGLIGKEIGKKLVSQGHEITVLTRNIEDAKSQLPFPAKFLAWKNYTEALPSAYFDNIDTVIHLAGESIASGRWTAERKKLILDSRVIGTRNIVEGIKKSSGSVKQFISASAIGIYEKGFLKEVCEKWEEEALNLKKMGIKVVNPRIGIVLTRNGGALEKMLPVFGVGLGGVIGSGKQWMSWIHQEDLTRMFTFIVENPQLEGAFDGVAPAPATNKEFSKALAQALGRNLFFPVPAFVIKVALGEMSTLVVNGEKVTPEKILSKGFEFKYKELQSALNDICAPLRGGTQEMFTEIWLPKKTHEIFPFFTDEKNLEKLTPEYLNFKVLKKSTPSIDEGTLIDYRLKLHGFPMMWRTLIESWVPGKKFVDRQLKGPYQLWHHTHEFEEVSGGTLMRDRVLYRLPLGRLGALVSGPFVRSDVTKIFSYRKKVIRDLFYPADKKS